MRFETGIEQPTDVDEEKKAIYEPTIHYFKENYSLHGNTEVVDLLGARGTINKCNTEFFKRLKIDLSVTREIAITVLKYSIQMLRNHLYNSINTALILFQRFHWKKTFSFLSYFLNKKKYLVCCVFWQPLMQSSNPTVYICAIILCSKINLSSFIIHRYSCHSSVSIIPPFVLLTVLFDLKLH